jgi:hypothetical protein
MILMACCAGEPRRELSVCVLRDGDIQKLIGVALWMYNEQRMAVCSQQCG